MKKQTYKSSGKIRRKIKWRGHEILRIEAFSDAVFAFAVTLLVISLEVPKTFDELIEGMTGLGGFAVCFALLFLIWYEQYIFFRMFYLKDSRTIWLNGLLLFLVLCYIYPLKFLFSLLLEGNEFKHGNQILQKVSSNEQVKFLMIIYGIGFCLVYLIFFFMYINVLLKKQEIKLTPIEQFYTKSELYKQLLLIIIGLITIVGACVLPVEYAVNVGMFYILIGPVFFVYYSIRGKMINKKFTAEELIAHDHWLEEKAV